MVVIYVFLLEEAM